MYEKCRQYFFQIRGEKMNSEIKVDFIFFSYYITWYALTIFLISQTLLAVHSVIMQIPITHMFRLMSTFSGGFDKIKQLCN